MLYACVRIEERKRVKREGKKLERETMSKESVRKKEKYGVWRGRWDVWDKERHVIRAHGALPWKP